MKYDYNNAANLGFHTARLKFFIEKYTGQNYARSHTPRSLREKSKIKSIVLIFKKMFYHK